WPRRLLEVRLAEQRSAWSDSWDEFVPQLIPRGRQTGRRRGCCRVKYAGQRAVPPAGFEPALPPPEAGRCRDRRSLVVPYLGLLFAFLVFACLPCPVV